MPIAGAVVVGLMARYGSAAIRGHGIPEAMEQVLLNKSRIPARITLLKPVSAAISIGTGGPFGAEGPIIATGGAVGSLVGQLLHTTAVERKTLLAAGAAAGMTATFGSPVSAVLLAVELLLFELRPRSLIPVALAAAAAMAVRIGFVGITPAFAMPNIAQPGEGALAAYVLLGALVGVAAVAVTKVVYAIEDAFDHLPIHWMWWPAIGAVAVGVCGYFSPHTLGVGYDNIERILSGDFGGQALLVLGVLKFVSWSISLGRDARDRAEPELVAAGLNGDPDTKGRPVAGSGPRESQGESLQCLRTFCACNPFGPLMMSNSTRSPSLSERKPSIWMAV